MIAPTKIAAHAALNEGGGLEEQHHPRKPGVIGPRAGRGSRGGAGQSAAEAWRHPRHVGPLRRHHRLRQRDRCQDGGGGFLLDNQGVEAIIDVAASATALAANEIAKARNKIIMFSGPGSVRLTNEACGPYSVHYVYDTFALANSTGIATVKTGLDTWFFLQADYAFGQDLEKDTTNVVTKLGGKVLGTVKHPLNTSDFSSFLLQAQASKAKVIGLANAGGDTINAIKQASEFGLMKGGQKLSPLLAFITDIDSIGLETAQGMVLAEAFYWDLNDEPRAFSKRFMEKVKRAPTSAQAGIYSSTLHYLKAVKAAGTTDAAAVMKIMKATPVNDMFAKNGRIREDGRMMREMYLFEVKKPSESKYPWDYCKLVATIPADQAFMPLSKSTCPLVKK